MSSNLKVTNIKHESSGSNNLVLGSDGDISVTNNLNVGAIKDATGNTTAMQINSSGHVTRNVIPSWCLARSEDQDITSALQQTKILFDDQNSTSTLHLNGGCTLSSGSVTVPTAGLYNVGASVRYDNVGSGYVEVTLTKNEVISGQAELYIIDGGPASSYATNSGSMIFYVTDSDISSGTNNFQVNILSSGDSSFHVAPQSIFWGYLVG